MLVKLVIMEIYLDVLLTALLIMVIVVLLQLVFLLSVN